MEKQVGFPGINLELQVSDIAFVISDVKVYWYGILIISAIIVMSLALIKESKRYKIKYENILEMLVITIPISFICARIYYVIFEFDYYSQNLNQILNIKNGGLAIYGGIIGGVISIYVYSKIKKMKFLDILDMIVPYLALGQAIGRWGNFFNLEAYGSVTTNILRMGIIENGKYVEVHPTFLYESICTFVIFILLTVFKKYRKYSGQLVVSYAISYSVVRFFIEGLRTDSLMVGDFRVSQIVSILIFLIASIIGVSKYKKMKIRNKPENMIE